MTKDVAPKPAASPPKPNPVERLSGKLDELEQIDAAIAARLPSRRHSIDTAKRLQAELEAGDRATFIETLASYVDSQPSLGALKQMAEADPLKHMQGMKIAAGLAGVAERHEISTTARLSDGELIDQLVQAGWQPPAQMFPHELDLEAEPASGLSGDKTNSTHEAITPSNTDSDHDSNGEGDG